MGQAQERTGEETGTIPSGGDLSTREVNLDNIQGEARKRMLAQPLNPFVRLEIKLLSRVLNPGSKYS